MDISLSNAIIAETAQQRAMSEGELAAAVKTTVAPLLGGENVRVGETLVGDLQKLLAQMQAEQEERKVKLAHQQLSAVLTHLCGLENLTVEQQAQVTLMQLKIEALEAAVERETVTVAERKKALETKRRLEEQATKELADAEKSGDKTAIAAAQKKLAAAQTETAALNLEIADLDAKISSLKKDVSKLGSEVGALLAKLDYASLVVVLAAVSLSAAQATPADENLKKDEENAEKIPTALDIVRDSIEKAGEDIREEIVEKRIDTI